MAQHDYNIVNAPGSGVRADLNSVLAAIVSNNSGLTEPTSTFPFMFWYDMSVAAFKVRNAANTGWDLLSNLVGGSGSSGGGLEFIAEYTSVGTTITIPIPAGHQKFALHLTNLKNTGAADQSCECRVGTAASPNPFINNGITTDSSSTSVTTGTTTTTAADVAANRFFIHANNAGTNWGNQADEEINEIITVENPGSATAFSYFTFEGSQRNSTTGTLQYNYGAAVRREKSRISELVIFGSGGLTLTGNARLYAYN
jgi:hypothetical protein